MGAGSVVFGALALPSAFTQSALLAPWWSLTFITLLIGLPVVVAIGAIANSLRVMRGAAWALTVTMPVAMLTFVLAMAHPPLVPVGETPWLYAIAVVPTSAACLILRRRWAWTYLIAIAVGLGALRLVTMDSEHAAIVALEDVLFIILLGAIFAAAILAVLRAGRILDSSIARASEEAATIAEAQARARENEAFDALVHDEILSTLVGVLRQPVDSGGLVAQAQRALTRIGQLENSDGPTELPAEQFADRLEEVLGDISTRPSLSRTIRVGATLSRSAHVALLDATREAVRNALRHSSSTSAIRVDARVDGLGATVTVADTGPGFDPENVDEARLGIRLSIIGRMNALPGGSASVQSSPGAGTIVRMMWRR